MEDHAGCLFFLQEKRMFQVRVCYAHDTNVTIKFYSTDLDR